MTDGARTHDNRNHNVAFHAPIGYRLLLGLYQLAFNLQHVKEKVSVKILQGHFNWNQAVKLVIVSICTV